MRGKRVRFFAFVLVVLTIGYGVFQARVLIRGPILTVLSPTRGETLTDQLYVVSGKAENSTRVLVNGKVVLADLDGKFTHTLATPEGYGVTLVEAQNRFGRTAVQRIEFFGSPVSNEGIVTTASSSASTTPDTVSDTL